MKPQHRTLQSIKPNADQATQNLRPPAPRKVELGLIRTVNGHNPRGFALGEHAFTGEKFDELVDSIRSYGDVLNPVLLRPVTGKANQYELVSGERRVRAARAAGLDTISCEIRDLDDDQMFEAALAENAVREDVAKIDTILATLYALSGRTGVPVRDLRTWFIRLRKTPPDTPHPEGSTEHRLTQQMHRLGMPSLNTLIRSWARYVDLTPDERLALRNGLPERAALHLLDLGDRPERAHLLEQAMQHAWTGPQMAHAVHQVLHAEHDAREPAHLQAARTVRDLLKPAALAKLPPEQADQLRRDLEQLIRRYAPRPD